MLAGSAAEFERDIPFSVWVDALDAYVASQNLELDDELADELATILPALRRPGATYGHAVADERYRAHRAASTLLGRLSDDQALVLILDDLHWSDGASVDLIASLLRRWTERVGAARAGLPPGAGARAPDRGARGAGRDPRRPCAADAGAGGATAGRRRPGDGRRDVPPRRRQPVLPRAARARAVG